MAVFVVAAVVMLGLLPSLVRSAGDSADAATAQGLAGALRVEVTRQIGSAELPALADRVPVMGVPLAGGMAYVAERSGGTVQAHDDFLPSSGQPIPEVSQFFLIETWRFAQPPLAYTAGDDVLVLFVRVSWPYRVPGAAAPTPLAARRQEIFTLSLRP